MPHSSGGGSHSGGFHSSSGGSGSSNSPHISTHYFPGARRFIRHNHTLGKDEYIYATSKPGKTSLGSVIAVALFAAVFSVISIFGISSELAFRIDPEYDDVPRVCDDINVIDNEDSLTEVLAEYQEITGICPVLYTMYNEGWEKDYYSLAQYTFDKYLDICDDEQHWVIVYSIPESYSTELGRARSRIPEYRWEAVQGDETDRIITEKAFSEFGNLVQNNLESGKDPGTSFEEAFDQAVRNARNNLEPGPSKVSHIVSAFMPVFIVLCIFVPVIVLMIKKYRNDRHIEYEEVPLGFDPSAPQAAAQVNAAANTVTKAVSVFAVVFLIPFVVVGIGVIIGGVSLMNSTAPDASMGGFLLVFGLVWTLISGSIFIKMVSTLIKSKKGDDSEPGISVGSFAQTYTSGRPEQPSNPVTSKPSAPASAQYQSDFDPKFFQSSKSDYEEDDEDFKRMKRQGYE